MRRLARFTALAPDQRGLVLAAGAQLMLAAITVRIRTFPQIAAQLGPMQAPHMSKAGNADQQAAARDVRWALTAWQRHTPLRPACLARALAARQLCAARGLDWTLHMGADPRRSDGETHAWLDATGVPVTGYPLPPGMVEVGCFTGRTAASSPPGPADPPARD